MHRCLSDGSLSFNIEAPTARHLCILGGQQLYKGDDYIVSFVNPPHVKHVADAIGPIDEAWMRERYFALDASDYGMALSEEDFESTWSWFQGARNLYQKAALAECAVLFTVDQ